MLTDLESERNALVERVAGSVENRRNATVLKLLNRHKNGLTGAELATACDAAKLSKVQMTESYCRRVVTDLRKAIDAYHRRDPGLDEPLRLSIPKNKRAKLEERYVLEFDLNNGADSFWKAHLQNGRENGLILTEPVFFRDTVKRHLYLRHFEVNDSGNEGVAALREKVSGLESIPLEGVHHYVSLSEMKGMLVTVGFLEGFRDDLAQPVTQQMRSDDDRLETRHVVAFGTSRANSEVEAIQKKYHLGYSIEEEHFLIREPLSGERALLSASGAQFHETPIGIQVPDRGGRHFYAVVTRGVRSNGFAKTAIASNHGVATQGVCEFLTDEANVKNLIREMHLDEDWQGFPKRFQIVFQVELDSKEITPKQVSYVSWRGEKDGGPI